MASMTVTSLSIIGSLCTIFCFLKMTVLRLGSMMGSMLWGVGFICFCIVFLFIFWGWGKQNFEKNIFFILRKNEQEHHNERTDCRFEAGIRYFCSSFVYESGRCCFNVKALVYIFSTWLTAIPNRTTNLIQPIFAKITCPAFLAFVVLDTKTAKSAI